MAFVDPIERVSRKFLQAFAPPPNLTVSQWADEYLYLSPEDSAEPGKFKTDRAPYQRGMMDAVSEPTIKEVVYCTSSQIGKALSISTPIPVPSGWKTMGELVVGDQVFDETGRPCHVTFVTEVMYDRKCYRVEFSDGAVIIADAEHQWYVEYDHYEGDNRYHDVLTTQTIFENQHWYSQGKRRNRYAIPVALPLELPEADLPIDPYLLGVWLGDGYSGQARIICHEDDADHFEASFVAAGHRASRTGSKSGVIVEIDKKLDGFCKRGHELSGDNVYLYPDKPNSPICRKCVLDGEAVRKGRKEPEPEWVNFSKLLRVVGVWNNKHIPASYLRGSADQRLALLQGLMDTDGYAGKGTARSEFVTTSKPIADGFGELLASLGIKYTLSERLPTTTYKGEKVNGKLAYRFSFLAYSETPVFRLKRKLERMVSQDSVGPKGGARRTQETFRRRIVSVTETPSVPVKCIQVDSSNHLYLAGDRMVPTHNTLISKAILGYHIHQDPGPLLVMQPTVSVAETFSKDRLAPMVRDTPVLKELLADPKSRTSSNTILKKNFRGGQLTMIGSTAPTELASRPIRIVFADEVDRYPHSAGTEGDPLFLARQRSVTFHNRKFIMASTPTLSGSSRIWQAFEASDQRYYWLPCPHCGERHVLKWAQMVWTGQDPSTARMACPHCGGLYGDAEKLKMLYAGEWRASTSSIGIAGFHISALYSPWQTFADVVSEFLSKKNNTETLKTFINLQLGECWEDRSGEAVDHQALMNRREAWDKNALPEDIVVCVAGVDVQDDRLEYSVIGYTATEQARVLGHYQIWGSPGQPEVWQRLDEAIRNEYFTADGRILRIRATAVDSGGHHTQAAYEFCRNKSNRKVMAIKGQNGAKPIWPLKATKTTLSRGVRLFLVGVDTAKDALRSALAVASPELPRYVAFSDTLPDAYFQQLTSEKRYTVSNKAGRAVRTWRKAPGVRNEALDCFVYAIAALEMLKQGGLDLRMIARRLLPEAEPPPLVVEQPVKKKRPARPMVKRSSAL